jgi:putative transposase
MSTVTTIDTPAGGTTGPVGPAEGAPAGVDAGQAGPAGAAGWPNRGARRAAEAQGLDALLDDQVLDEAVAALRANGGKLTGPGGVLPDLIRKVLERGLAAELDEHLGYRRHEAAGRGSGNSRNGATPKTVDTEVGPVTVAVPRDRAGTFTPMLLPKHERSLGGFSDIIISLYAGGMTVRDIAAHLHRAYGTDLSPDTISTITDSVLAEVAGWQQRPLDEVYPIIYVDCLMVKVRDGGMVRNKAAYLVVGVDLDGVKHVLGIWIAATEGAKFWMQVCTELRNRGVRDVLIACCDGLTGLPEAIETVWPQSVVQTCVVHYPEGVIMPMPGAPALVSGGARGCRVGIITAIRGRRAAGRRACSGRAVLRLGRSGRGPAA